MIYFSIISFFCSASSHSDSQPLSVPPQRNPSESDTRLQLPVYLPHIHCSKFPSPKAPETSPNASISGNVAVVHNFSSHVDNIHMPDQFPFVNARSNQIFLNFSSSPPNVSSSFCGPVIQSCLHDYPHDRIFTSPAISTEKYSFISRRSSV